MRSICSSTTRPSQRSPAISPTPLGITDLATWRLSLVTGIHPCTCSGGEGLLAWQLGASRPRVLWGHCCHSNCSVAMSRVCRALPGQGSAAQPANGHYLIYFSCLVKSFLIWVHSAIFVLGNALSALKPGRTVPWR